MTEKPTVKLVDGVPFQYRKRYEVTCDMFRAGYLNLFTRRFNTASGMRSHVTKVLKVAASRPDTFQYRKRYEVTCDFVLKSLRRKVSAFQYRKRYEVTCDVVYVYPNKLYPLCFNTASGMRSHVTW